MVSAVVLAAGASTRMGSPKLLLPLGDEPIVRRTVRQVCHSGFDDVLIVSGAEHERIAAALDGLTVRHVADQPFLTSTEYAAILQMWRLRTPPIVGSRFGDVTAPPHLFVRALYPELAVLEHGARSVLQRHQARMVVMHFEPTLLLDIDTPEDYERAIARLSGA
jgi:molybdenum cofactor cytidylyltransferase